MGSQLSIMLSEIYFREMDKLIINSERMKLKEYGLDKWMTVYTYLITKINIQNKSIKLNCIIQQNVHHMHGYWRPKKERNITYQITKETDI